GDVYKRQKKDFYDYKSKYIDGDTALIIPAEMSEEESNVIKRDAIVAFQSLDGAGSVSYTHLRAHET
ncbi:hypothetical protein JDS68_29800, partial [Bacillus cereus group sp. N3]|nr:hypothetical protein [Bacillus cereus group sp. N3]